MGWAFGASRCPYRSESLHLLHKQTKAIHAAALELPGTDSLAFRCHADFSHAGHWCVYPVEADSGCARSGTFTERSTSGPDASHSGFCGIMCPGDIYVGVPSMDAVCKGLASHPNLRSHWGSRVICPSTFCMVSVDCRILVVLQPVPCAFHRVGWKEHS